MLINELSRQYSLTMIAKVDKTHLSSTVKLSYNFLDKISVCSE